MCHELAMFWNKKQVLHKGTYGIIIEFSKPGMVPARKEGRTGNYTTFTTAELQQGGFRIKLSSCAHLW